MPVETIWMISQPPSGSSRPKDGRTAARQLGSGMLWHASLQDDAAFAPVDAPSVVVKLGGRGHAIWPGMEARDRHCGSVFVPSGHSLQTKGDLRVLSVLLPELRAALALGPVHDVLVGLLCRRAWHRGDCLADASLKVVRLLLEEAVWERGETHGKRLH